jgi:DivIVA domain-containing protein
MRKKDKDVDDAQDFAGMPASTVVTPADIQSKEFSVSRFGGYRMRDVDEFLDHITESMTKLSDENERLRTATGLPAAPSIGAPDLADTSRQADEIIERARAEAATILQDARAQAATAAGGAVAAAAGTDAGRAAVAPFLSQERDFLQQLAALVQSHAESVKGMAKASRAKPAAAPSPVASAPAAPPVAQAPVAPAAAPASDETQPMPRVGPREATTPSETSGSPQPEEASPIRVEEPATASVSAGDSDDDAGSGDGGDRTLRELFWGEE